MSKEYSCSLCGRKHVKLWRPYMDIEPLICASCAEKLQVPRTYDEQEWSSDGEHFIGTPTGKKLPLPKWTVDKEGLVPSYHGPLPKECEVDNRTDQLIVNLKDVHESYSSGETTLVPAIPDNAGTFWGYTSVPEYAVKRWQNWPTH